MAYTVLCKMIFRKIYAPSPEPVHKKQWMGKENEKEGVKERIVKSEQARKKVINI